METTKIEAYDERTAKTEARRYLNSSQRLKGVLSRTPGKKGLLGIGKKPNNYEIQIFQQAVVEITYKEKAKIRATVGEKSASEKQETRPKTTTASGQGNGYNRWQTCRFGVERTEGQFGSFIIGACCTNNSAARTFGMMKWSTFIKLTTLPGQRGKSPFSSEAYVLTPGANCRECSQCYFYTKTRSKRPS